MIEVMRINPFTGIGLTSGEIISEHIFTTANNYNISLETARYRQNLFQIPNAFFDIFISFGILGSMLIAFICKRIVNFKNITWIDCVSILLLINTAGILNIFLYQSIFALYFTVDE